MESGNITHCTEFIVLGFYEWPDLQLILFMMFFLIYLVGIMGNLTIVTLIVTIPHLHTPMYFFLCNLSILDITFPSTVLPKLLDICLTGNQSITYAGCISQIFFSVICVASEYFLLSFMAYDRYVAICHPLRYSYLINLSICIQMALVSCTGTWEIELAIQVTGTLLGFVPLAFIIITYIFIISSILSIRSNEGKRKAFSTCSSHLTVVTLFFGIILGMYMKPNSAYSIEQDKLPGSLGPVVSKRQGRQLHWSRNSGAEPPPSRN
ncbi:olfactory receptor 5V1-like [Discoglossus pictus]